MIGTEEALLSAVAARRSGRRTAGDVLAERILSAFGIGMLVITIYGTLRMFGFV